MALRADKLGMHSISGTKGFHLFEVVLSLSVCSIVAFFSLLAFRELPAYFRLRLETKKLTSYLQQLSARALGGAQELEVQVSAHALTAQSSRLREVYTIESPVIADVGAQSGTIMFYASGAVTPKSITLRHGSRSCEVVISIRGRARWSC